MKNYPQLFSAEELRDSGIQRSVDTADSKIKHWSEQAFNFLVSFANTESGLFLIEDVRNASDGIIPEPPSARAWGSIAVRAAKNGIIKQRGYAQVKNKKAHCTPAAIWEGIK